GKLPLAIEQASKYILKEGISFDEYINRYKAKARELLSYKARVPGRRTSPAKPGAQGQETVYTTFEVTRDILSPLSQLLLHCMSYFAPDDIPLTVFRGIEGVASPGDDDIDESLEELEEFSLIKRSSDRKTASLHRLVQ